MRRIRRSKSRSSVLCMVRVCEIRFVAVNKFRSLRRSAMPGTPHHCPLVVPQRIVNVRGVEWAPLDTFENALNVSVGPRHITTGPLGVPGVFFTYVLNEVARVWQAKLLDPEDYELSVHAVVDLVSDSD